MQSYLHWCRHNFVYFVDTFGYLSNRRQEGRVETQYLWSRGCVRHFWQWLGDGTRGVRSRRSTGDTSETVGIV